MDSTWSARVEPMISLRNICRNHPLLIEKTEARYSVLDKNKVMDIKRKEHEMKVLKTMIEFYRKQLHLAKIEIIMRHDNRPILCFR
jgi:hypothetical protein